MSMLSRFATLGGAGGAGSDPYWSYVTLLLNGNGTNGSQVFTDLSSNTKAFTNNGVTVNTTTKKYGTGSMAFSGSNYLTLSNTGYDLLGAGGFTVELWQYQQTTQAWANVVGNWNDNGGATSSWFYMYDGSGKPYFGKKNTLTSGDYQILASTTSVPLNTWFHVAIVKNNNIWTIYLNGVSIASFTATTGLVNSTSPMVIGAQTTTGNYPYTGYIDDLRITKGIARYTTNFTPPTVAFPTG